MHDDYQLHMIDGAGDGPPRLTSRVLPQTCISVEVQGANVLCPTAGQGVFRLDL